MTHVPGISPNISEAIWRKSSHSGGQGDCVEVAEGIPAHMPVRDSKSADGPVIVFGRHAWQAFMVHLT